MNNVVVIGAGASGIIAALKASEHNNVLLFDSNDKIGKKILITGNGRCNYWNDEIGINKYYTDNPNVLNEILKYKDTTLEYISSLGIYPKVINGYYYPNNFMAISIKTTFEREINNHNIKLHLSEEVLNIKQDRNKFKIYTTKSTYQADKLIIATGSKAFPKTGSTGKGYEILSNLGIAINPVYPALTKLISTDKIVSKWENIRLDGKITININEEDLVSSVGELQLTKNGISGIPTFNVSSVVSRNLDKKVYAKIDFLPEIEDLKSIMTPNKTLEEILETLLNYKLTFALLESIKIDKNSKWSDLSDNEKEKFIKTVKSFKLNIIDTDTFENSQVCTGGLSLNEVKPSTMELKSIPNIYVTGEVLDVDGICGGYNLGFAFITGYIAGSNMR